MTTEKLEKYEKLKKKLEAAEKRVVTAQAKRSECYTALEEERKNLVLPCECGAENIVGEIELIEEDYGSYDSYGENYNADIRSYFVCPKCTDVFNLPDKEKLSEWFDLRWEGFSKYVKITHKFHYGSMPQRVIDLLKPSKERAEKRKIEKEKEYRLEQARKILRDAGELPSNK